MVDFHENQKSTYHYLKHLTPRPFLEERILKLRISVQNNLKYVINVILVKKYNIHVIQYTIRTAIKID